VIEQESIKFEVRIIETLAKKPKGEGSFDKKPDFDPFLPPEAGLLIGDLS
jgi:ATP adenylyltransferase/5',5'''-P-1,P-4-tetraphosphate phosphorylase II